MSKYVKVPGALWITLAAVLIALNDQLQLQFAGAEWLPIVVAVVGYAAKLIQMKYEESSSETPKIPGSDYFAPSATPLPPRKTNAALKFFLG